MSDDTSTPSSSSGPDAAGKKRKSNADKAQFFAKVSGKSRKGPKQTNKQSDRQDNRGRGKAQRDKEQRGSRKEEAIKAGSDQPVWEKPMRVGGVRNEHGTRVARRVECAKCSAIDHVSYLDKNREFALCRTCAEDMLNVFEVGRKKSMPTRPETCNLCGVPFEIPVTAEDDGDPLCQNCLREWLGWQGSIDQPYEERQRNLLEKKRPGIALRRRPKKAGAASSAPAADAQANADDPEKEVPSSESAPQETAAADDDN
mgnify:CR=1 FL=1